MTKFPSQEPYHWPNCRKPCPLALPAPDAVSAMRAVDPKTRVPEGKFGQYVCNDTSLGVDKGPSEFLNVLCQCDEATGACSYDVPPDGEWPRCKSRTTTVSPGKHNKG